MLLESFIPILPASTVEFLIFYASIVGALFLVYSQFVEAENRRDILRMFGALGLLSYAIWRGEILFILTFLGIFAAALIEFIEILTGYHKHIRSPGTEIFEHIQKTGLFWKKKKH